MSEPETRFKVGDEVLVRATVIGAEFYERQGKVMYDLNIEGQSGIENFVPMIYSDDVHPVPKD